MATVSSFIPRHGSVPGRSLFSAARWPDAAALAGALLLVLLSPGILPAQDPPGCIEGSCHMAIQKKLKKGTSVHEVARDGSCDSCHEPHANGRPGKLRRPLGPICAECHVSVATRAAAGRSVHRPNSEDKCQACHDPHASGQRSLLVARFPAGSPARFDPVDYGLCWGCHPRDLAMAGETVRETLFRNGVRNLHALHLSRGKGTTCLTCHDIHKDAPVKLLVEGKGGPAFTRDPNGGGCLPACHKQKRYDRVKPVKT